MTKVPNPRRLAVISAAVLAAAGLAACSSSAKPPSASSVGKPVYGGTLNIVAASGPDHIDTVPAYYTADYELERGYARQLVSYPTVPATSTSSAGWTTDTTPVADVATEVPTVANGGITGGGKTYTFHIKPGVDWDSSPVRQVTSYDFLREFKAFCNPVSPVGNETYYISTIVGMNAYCNSEASYFANAKVHAPTAANIAGFQNSNAITGIATPDSMTIQFTLIQPASDFLNMLAMPFASARPAEYDTYVPNSLQLDQHTLSDGPYQISSYLPGKSITMVRNPAWKQSTDPIRHDYVSEVQVTLGVTSASTQLADMEAGTEDLPMDTAINPASISGLLASNPSDFRIWPDSDLYPYAVFNLRSPDANGAMGKLLVRQAIEYGLDKAAAVKAIGGPAVAQVTNTVVPPGNVGYVNYNLYPDDSGQGNVAMCKSDLAKAGYPNGLTLLYMYQNDSSDTRIFTAIQASLALCGVTLQGKPEPGSSIFVDLGDAPEGNKAGDWDMGQAIWFPDWFGNNGRTTVQALFAGPDCGINTVNDGCYDSATVNNLIGQAEAASSLAQAGSFWHQADEDIMSDAAIVPIMSQQFPLYASARVRGVNYPTAIFAPNIGDPDITSVWLANG
ncbi:MAG TPA: ABC transporter substrate-binding protein [Streptosporangiaceae bacterium]|nr:ABC transporter substrate-binding protein [Streptosporangiaceae bacterium]